VPQICGRSSANYRSEGTFWNSKNRRPVSDSLQLLAARCGPPPTTGGLPKFVCHHGTSSSPPIVYVYMSSSSPLCKPSHLTTTTVYSSVPVDGVAKSTLLTQNKPVVLMAPRRNAPVDPRLPKTLVQDLQRLHDRVERRRPKSKIKRPREYYQDLIEQHDSTKTVIKHRYSDTTKDNLRGIRGKFIR
jgi:hypothetical protein